MKKQDYEPLWTLKKDTQTHSVWSREEGQLGLGGRAHGGLEWAFAGAHQWRRFLRICCRPFPAAFLENSHRAQIWSPQPKFWERFFIIVAGMSFCWCSSMAAISLHLLRAFSCCFSGKFTQCAIKFEVHSLNFEIFLIYIIAGCYDCER